MRQFPSPAAAPHAGQPERFAVSAAPGSGGQSPFAVVKAAGRVSEAPVRTRHRTVWLRSRPPSPACRVTSASAILATRLVLSLLACEVGRRARFVQRIGSRVLLKHTLVLAVSVPTAGVSENLGDPHRITIILIAVIISCSTSNY